MDPHNEVREEPTQRRRQNCCQWWQGLICCGFLLSFCGITTLLIMHDIVGSMSLHGAILTAPTQAWSHGSEEGNPHRLQKRQTNDDIAELIHASEKIRDDFKPSSSAGFSFDEWLHDTFGPWGAMFFELLIPVLIILGIMLCICTIAMASAKALIHKWVDTVVRDTLIVHQRLAQHFVQVEEPKPSYSDLFPMPDWTPPFAHDTLDSDCELSSVV